MKYKVLITTSGIGSRLGDLTKYTNKSLVNVGKKPAISYIVESYPKNTHYVITLGYYGDQVRDFLELAYPERTFEFVVVDKYDGPGTSLGYSMLQAKETLQCPFIYHASDTIVNQTPPAPKTNWIGVHKGDDSAQYASWIRHGTSLVFQDKGAIEFDCLHIGLVGIKDYQLFWQVLSELHAGNQDDKMLNDCVALARMLDQKVVFDLVEFPLWLDIGNPVALRHTREILAEDFTNLDKLEEDIFLLGDHVIKFFFDEKVCASRVVRAKQLQGLVPTIEGARKNFYRYSYQGGDLYASVAKPTDFKQFLAWAEEYLWRPVNEMSRDEFKRICLVFYKDKTEARIQKFLSANSLEDGPTVINGESIPAVSELMRRIDFDWLSNADQYQFHGDFILDNIIKTNNGYCLLDWRQDFGGSLGAGDRYYDLAKLNHNLTVNHGIVHDNLFWTKTNSDGSISVDIYTKSSLNECKQLLCNFIKDKSMDQKRVDILTGIIWLNMSPLHHHPFNVFLFYFGKYHLWQALNCQ
ncbi:MAG: hypothetical protein Q8P93_04955 [bacterium]|nr:hypothetical protein [bacterium]